MKILEIETEHSGPIKVLFEVLKDMLTDTNIEFSSIKKKDVDTETEEGDQTDTDIDDSRINRKEQNCMKINAVDPSKTVLINLKLDGINFNKFVCKKSKLLLGVNLSCFYKLIKSIGKNDILTLDMDHDNKNLLNIKIDGNDRKKVTEYNMKLLDLAETKISIPEITFDAVITMDSQEFNKLCRDMNNIADYVEIQCLHDKIIFTCKGEIANQKTTYKTALDDDDDQSILVSISHASKNQGSNAPQIVQGIFELKNLVLFSKCASLSGEIEIFMKNSFPLVIKYTIATLGRILLCLTPITEDSTKDANYSDEDEFYSDEDK